MRTRLAVILLTSLAVFGKDKPPAAQAPKDPLTDRMRFEIAVAQRDFVAAYGPYQQALQALQEKVSVAQKACEAANKQYFDRTYECVEKPPAPKPAAPAQAQPPDPKKEDAKK